MRPYRRNLLVFMNENCRGGFFHLRFVIFHYPSMSPVTFSLGQMIAVAQEIDFWIYYLRIACERPLSQAMMITNSDDNDDGPQK